MGYEVINSTEETIISDNDSGLKAKVTCDEAVSGTPFCLGTFYAIRGGFVPIKIYLFQAMNENADAENLKRLAVFFFSSLLDTELYVVEIPRESALFPQEVARIFGSQNYERAI